MKNLNCQTLIIGSGIAGLYAAIKISQKTEGKIILVTKAELETSNSRYAQGGMVAVLKENEKDSVDLHVQDTLLAGDGLCNEKAVRYISKNSERVIKDLLAQGVEFDTDEEKHLRMTLEGAHSINRILHSGGDATGKFIELALVRKVRSISQIEVIENGYAVELLKDNENNCCGAVILRNGDFLCVDSQTTVLSTGGMGQLYSNTTNPTVATADGVALAIKAGVRIANLEFIQFHPTALAFPGKGNRFLISEALRGEGAVLRNAKGERFMSRYDEKMELASRDKVTRAIFKEMKKDKTPNVWLDATSLDKKLLQQRFPTILRECLSHGIDISKDYIPVSPAAHYSMGGVDVDLNCKTSMNNLYAIGEISHTGLHGANRLASNSLLECVVCADRVSDSVREYLNNNEETGFVINNLVNYEVNLIDRIENYSLLRAETQNIMWNYVGVVRNEQSLMTAKEKLSKLAENVNFSGVYVNPAEYETINLLMTARVLTEMALKRKESRGAHYRSDFPEKYDNSLNQYYKEGKIDDKVFA